MRGLIVAVALAVMAGPAPVAAQNQAHIPRAGAGPDQHLSILATQAVTNFGQCRRVAETAKTKQPSQMQEKASECAALPDDVEGTMMSLKAKYRDNPNVTAALKDLDAYLGASFQTIGYIGSDEFYVGLHQRVAKVRTEIRW